MSRKEFHRRHLPHFQQSDQAYFVTWSLKDAIPPKALESYSSQIKQLKMDIDIETEKSNDLDKLNILKQQLVFVRRNFLKAYDDILHLQSKYSIDLSKPVNSKVVIDALCFWEDKRIRNYAICVMPNHIHWVFCVLKNDENSQPVYLQDILQSVKRYSANQLNALEGLKGSVWQSESYDTTIRNELHLHNAIEYTINNPVSAGLVRDWWSWGGTKLFMR